MDRTKHGLRISHFLALNVRALWWRKRERKKRRRRKKEEGRREEEENPGLEISYSCLEHIFCLELLDLLVRKPP